MNGYTMDVIDNYCCTKDDPFILVYGADMPDDYVSIPLYIEGIQDHFPLPPRLYYVTPDIIGMERDSILQHFYIEDIYTALLILKQLFESKFVSLYQ